MNRRPSQDVRPLVGVVVGLAAVSVLGAARSSSGIAQRAASLLGSPLLLIAVALLVAGMIAARAVASRRSLESRTRLVVLAPDSFDPSPDAVLRFAAQLSRVQRLVGGWLDPRARAVRVLLDADEEGRMRYSLCVPERALPAVRSALGVFDRVQAQVLDPEPAAGASSVQVVRAELRLARPSSEPLADVPLNPDPLQSFARVIARLDRSHGEQAQIAVDLLPTTPATRRRLRRRRRRRPAAAASTSAAARRTGWEGFSLAAATRWGGVARQRWCSSEPSGRRSARSCWRTSRCSGCKS